MIVELECCHLVCTSYCKVEDIMIQTKNFQSLLTQSNFIMMHRETLAQNGDGVGILPWWCNTYFCITLLAKIADDTCESLAGNRSPCSDLCCIFLRRNEYEIRWHFVAFRLTCLYAVFVIFWNCSCSANNWRAHIPYILTVRTNLYFSSSFYEYSYVWAWWNDS